MRILIQRTSWAFVKVEEKKIGEISQGMLVLCGFSPTDTEETLKKMLKKIISFRMFSDKTGKMNLSLSDIQGGLLLVPQFTLMADTHQGNRPGFSRGAPRDLGIMLFEKLKTLAPSTYPHAAFGEFGADMQVHLCNDGPVTFWMQFDE